MGFGASSAFFRDGEMRRFYDLSMNRLVLSTLLSVFALFSCATSPQAAQLDRLREVSITSSGVRRTFQTLIPEACRKQRCPLVLAFHGSGGTGKGLAKISHLIEANDKRGWALIFPDGVSKKWNDGRPGHNEDVQDVPFVDALIAWAKKEFQLDPDRIFATGFSNGGLFSFRLACERSEVFRAVAPVGAVMGLDLSRRCTPKKPVSLLSIVGTEDGLMPVEGGSITGPFGFKDHGQVLSSEETMRFWSKVLSCEPPAKKEIPGAPGSDTHTTDEQAQCRGGKRLARLLVHGGGHTWPGGEQYLGKFLIGVTAREFSASERILDFFAL